MTFSGLRCAFSLPCTLNFDSSFVECPSTKKPRITTMPLSSDEKAKVQRSKSAVSNFRGLPPPQPLPRTVHGPQRNLKFFGSAKPARRLQVGFEMGNFWSTIAVSVRRRREARGEAFNAVRKRVEVIDVDSKQSSDVKAAECVSIEECKRLVERQDGDLVVSNGPSSDVHLQEAKVLDSPSGPSLSVVSNLTVQTQKADNARKEACLVLVNDVVETKLPLYRELHESSKRRDSKLSSLEFELRLAEQKISAFKLKDQEEEVKEDVSYEPFAPLTDVEEDYVSDALFGLNRQQLLAVHDNSNIEITREVLQCLRPAQWLNDEVINLYLELLKEREKRAPQKFLKCHFFNTFFYKKLISETSGYDHKAVRRWTTQKKIGYGLIECDKIFVPIHKVGHWCLAVINIKDEKFQYLDSLGGRDPQVLKVLARYFVEEVKDKSNRDFNVTSWKQEFVDDLPKQKNGSDCGMFMIKYVDFYSRGLTLCFKQVWAPPVYRSVLSWWQTPTCSMLLDNGHARYLDHMPYFRKRTALEILRLRAQ